MKAVRVAHFGGPEVLEVTSLPDPEPGPGKLLLDVRAAALNWSDLLQRAGTDEFRALLPVIKRK